MNINFGCKLYVECPPSPNPKRILSGQEYSVSDVLASGAFKELPWRGKGTAYEYELNDGTRLWSASSLII